MKRTLLAFIILISSANCFSQVKESFPINFKRAAVHNYYKNYGTKIPIYQKKENNNLNQEISGNVDSKIQSRSKINLNSEEFLAGSTFYDLQTNNSINNCLSVNNDGSISMAWTFASNAIVTTNPPYPSRGSGYNYFNGSSWLFPAGPSQRQETIRTGFPNIVVTPSGKEMIISQASFGSNTDSTKISILWRPVKGNGTWNPILYPFGNNVFHSLPKACGGLTNENVYMIFQGTGDSSISMTPPHTIEGQNGPLYFSKSIDGGLTWSTPFIIPEINSTHYRGFNGDSYSIDATGDTVAISYGDAFTDVGLLKSTDAGATWTKYIIQLHPQPFYNPNTDAISDTNNDAIADTILSNGSDSKVLIDNNGMCHVWFSAFRYINDVTGDSAYTAFYGTDNLFYWNENMNQNYGYVAIASAQDLNGNGILDLPVNTSPICPPLVPWGQYGGGITQMPSAGIDSLGRLYISYQTIDELADTFPLAHRHIYMMTLPSPYNPADWTYPYDIIPSTAAGGAGEHEETVYACTARKVTDGFAYLLFSRDDMPGNVLLLNDTCNLSFGNSTDIILCKQDIQQLYLNTGMPEIISEKIVVSQNYPNPSKNLTEINVTINKTMNVMLEIQDLVGRIVYRENKINLETGTNKLQVDISALKSGVYNYTIIANGQKITKQMMVY